MAPEKTDPTDCPAATTGSSGNDVNTSTAATSPVFSMSMNTNGSALDTSSSVAAGTESTANTSTVSVDSTNGEHDPYFEPVVSLPEVTIKTNEEDEQGIYIGRCKLYRYNHENGEPGEWKERGTGNVKLLKNEDKDTIRLLMRQEKTLKVRANHYITPYMKLRANCGSDKAFVWHVMSDFADEEPKGEMFAIRFANADNARAFKEAFEDAVTYVISSIAEGFHEALEEAITEQTAGADNEDEEDGSANKSIKEETETSEDSCRNEDDGSANSIKEERKEEEEDKSETEVVEGLEKLKVNSEQTATQTS